MKGKRNEKRSKKSAILKQHARNLFVGVVIVLFVSMSFSAFFVSAKEKDTPDHESTYIYYKSIKIEKGDTLWDIANENLPEKYSLNRYQYTPYVLIYTLQPTAVRNRSNTHFYRLSYNIDQSIRQILIFPKDMDVKIYI